VLLTLKRLGQGTEGTFGALLDSDIPFAVTLEPEFKGFGSDPAGDISVPENDVPRWPVHDIRSL